MLKKMNGLSRDLIIHPGETLKDILEDRGMTQKELSIRTEVTEKHISTIINGLKPISVAFAKKLEYAFEIDASFWINLQANYDKELLDFEEVNNISKEEIKILKPLKDILEYFSKINILEKGLNETNKVLELRKILRVSNLIKMKEVSFSGAYRGKSKCSVDKNVLFAWQRLCEIRTSRLNVDKNLDVNRLKEMIPEIKKVMFEEVSTIEQKLTQIFAECGIAFAIVKHFKGAPVQGFIKKDDEGKVILAMTIRGAYADIFWFTLFHEIAHIIKGDIKQKIMIDYTFVENEVEKRADNMAKDILINKTEYKKFISNGNFSLAEINEFAKEQEVKNYIIIGRMQKDEYLPYSTFNNQKIRYKWAE